MSFADDDIQEIIATEEQIAERVAALAADITRDYAGTCPLLVGVLTGSFIFMADLVRQLQMPLEVAFCAASSYGDGTESCGDVTLGLDLCADVAGRHVVLVEDIVDTGRTLSCLVDLARERGCASVEVCCLLSKPARRVVPIEPRYVGFVIPDQFAVGYGLDYAHRYRHLPYVAVLKPHIYQPQV
jgi:hypoxanthine phosphoribosyltransferase